MTSRRSISTVERIRLGGTEQWIRIWGSDTSNPVLLLIPQGLGVPMMNEAADDNKRWQLGDEFVVVYWNQRVTCDPKTCLKGRRVFNDSDNERPWPVRDGNPSCCAIRLCAQKPRKTLVRDTV
jgi:hypothetical protein